MSVSFTIPGKPFAKQRARAGFNRGLGRVVTYDTKGNVSFERQVGTIASPLFPEPMQGPLRLTVEAVFEPAASHPRKRREAMLGTLHTQRPDTDNLLKSLKDGLNRIAWGDDCQVAEVSARKIWGERAETRVTIERA